MVKVWKILKARIDLEGDTELVETEDEIYLRPSSEPFFGSWTDDPELFENDGDIQLLVKKPGMERLWEFGNWFQREDVSVEDAGEEYPDIEILKIELDNAFVYDYIIVQYHGKKYKIKYDSDGNVREINVQISLEDLLDDLEFAEFAAWNVEDFVKGQNIEEVDDAISTFVMNFNDKWGTGITEEDVKVALREYYERFIRR